MIRLYLSGGASNANPAISLGGAKSSIIAPTGLFSPIPPSYFASGMTLFRCVYVHTNLKVNTVKASVSVETPSTATTVAVAWGSAVNVVEPVMPNQTTAPAYTFQSPASFDAAVSGGNFLAGQYRALWVRYQITPTGVIPSETFTLDVGGAYQMYLDGEEMLLDGEPMELS